MKDKTTFRNADELEPAQQYLFRSQVPVMGRSPQLACIINQLKMPPLPLLMSNIEQRRSLQKHGVVSCLLAGARIRIENLHKAFAEAIEQEKQKLFFVPMYCIEDAAPHEQLEQEPLTMEQFNQLCNA